MKFAGSASWSLSTSVDAMPHTALYIRDALGLDTSIEDGSPPPLSHRPPDRSNLLTEDDRAQASAQWPGWWRAVLEHEALLHWPSDRANFQDWYAGIAAKRALVIGDPPEFDALAGRQGLRRGVIELYPEARSYRERTRPIGVGEPMVPWTIARDVAEDVSRRHGVSLDDVRGVVLIIGVEGLWSRILERGVMVCSDACLADPVTSTSLVRDVFESGLER